jgi:tetratricopeptide (TPR) repeat protein
MRSAEYLLAAAVEKNPGDSETRLELSQMLLENGRVESAAEHFERLLEQTPGDPRGYIGLAEALYLKHSLSEADELLDRALEIDPRQTRGLLLRGKIEQARRHDERALEDYYQVLAFDPDQVEAKMLIAQLHLQRGDAKLAAPLVRSIIEGAEPGNRQWAGAQWLLGECYAHEGRWPDAARALEAGIAGRQGSARDWFLLADASWRAGDGRKAEVAVTQALRLAPDDAHALALRSAIERQARAGGLPGGPVLTRLSHIEADGEPPGVPETTVDPRLPPAIVH